MLTTFLDGRLLTFFLTALRQDILVAMRDSHKKLPHPIYLGWNDEEDQLQEQRTRIRLRSSKRTVRPESLTSVQNFIEAKIHNDGEEL